MWIWFEAEDSIFFSTWRIQFSQYLFWKRPSFPFAMWHLCHKLSDYVCAVCFKVSILFSQPVCLVFCRHCCIHYCHCYQVLTSSGTSPSALLFFNNTLISLGPLHSIETSELVCQLPNKTTTKENPAGILMGITWNLEIILGKTDTFKPPSASKYTERGQISCTTRGRAKWNNHWKPGSWAHATLWPSNSVPRHTPQTSRTYMLRRTCVRTLMAALCGQLKMEAS